MLLKDRKIIVTCGPTREWLDPVRFISNPSTGKMGIAIADEARSVCRETVLIHGPINEILLEDKNYRKIGVESTSHMEQAVLGELEDNAVIIMAAAPADFTPVSKKNTKIKKKNNELILQLKTTPDILKNISVLRKSANAPEGLFVVGFAAETDSIEENSIKKLKEKNLDMICLNDVSRKDSGFGTDTNKITIFNRDNTREELPVLSKNDAAKILLKSIKQKLPAEIQ